MGRNDKNILPDNGADNIPEIIPENVVEKVDRREKMQREIIEWIITIGVAFLIAFVLKTFFMTFASVDGDSMLPTLHSGDMLYVNKFMYTPEKGDIVIVDMESRDGADAQQRFHVKRVIATEGDTLYIDNYTNEVFVNGKVIDEPYINNKTFVPLNSYLFNEEFTRDNPRVLKEGEVFVMGDNRQHSLDNRINEIYTKDMIEGHALFRFWPLGDFGGAGNHEY